MDFLLRVSYVDILEYPQDKLVSNFENIMDFIVVIDICLADERIV
jgi:hypothetical protein